ncbi:MAG TPA: aminopeptidase P family protein [Prolixibacteraceae bacterium]|nr:aminopeptidase P family protein [Prolixibacteraceae bacterium]HPR60974.1 aminopeptidase P family protein [Prolixibacteraceae bacterium]
MLNRQLYIQRRSILKETIKKGIILFLGNEDSPMNYPDNPYPFRQHSSFLYYFGINRPSLTALIDIDNGLEIIFGDEYSMDDIVWMGNKPTIAELAEKVGVYEVLPTVKLFTILREANAAGRNIEFLPPYRPENKIKLLRLLNIRPDQFNLKASEALVKAVIAQREIKCEEEIAEIDKAVNWSVDMHVAAMQHARPGMKEAEIAAKVTQIALEREGYLSFPVIATVKGEVLHNHYHGNVLKKGQLFLLDCGAETPNGYAGDLTSTFPVSAKFSRKQAEIYQLVLDAHYAAVKMLKPGIAFREVHFEAARVIFDGLKALGITKGDTAEAVAEGAHAMFFPTGLGHMMGLDVHDMEDLGELNVGYNPGETKSTLFGLKSLRLAKELKTGHVLTVEPGIYFIPELIKMWKAEKRFEQFINYNALRPYMSFGGVRIEQDYLITRKSSRLLGRKKPMEIAEIESIRS